MGQERAWEVVARRPPTELGQHAIYTHTHVHCLFSAFQAQNWAAGLLAASARQPEWCSDLGQAIHTHTDFMKNETVFLNTIASRNWSRDKTHASPFHARPRQDRASFCVQSVPLNASNDCLAHCAYTARSHKRAQTGSDLWTLCQQEQLRTPSRVPVSHWD